MAGLSEQLIIDLMKLFLRLVATAFLADVEGVGFIKCIAIQFLLKQVLLMVL